jgi:hypothetical protein
VPYPSCPVCGMTIFHRYPLSLASPRECGRCAVRTGVSVTLERSPQRFGAAAATLVPPMPPR